MLLISLFWTWAKPLPPFLRKGPAARASRAKTAKRRVDKWEDMQLSDRAFICQNSKCAYYQFEQDRDYNASLHILRETLGLVGILDLAVFCTGPDNTLKTPVDLM